MIWKQSFRLCMNPASHCYSLKQLLCFRLLCKLIKTSCGFKSDIHGMSWFLKTVVADLSPLKDSWQKSGCLKKWQRERPQLHENQSSFQSFPKCASNHIGWVRDKKAYSSIFWFCSASILTHNFQNR